MNAKGIYSFLVVAGMAGILFYMAAAAESSRDSLKRAEQALIEAETINFRRTIIEENIDFAIREKLYQQLATTSNPQEIKKEINRMLAKLIEKIQESGPEAEFFTSNSGKIDEEYLGKISKVLVIDSKQGEKEGTYYIIRGFSGTETIEGKVSGKNFSQKFRIPAGYSIKVIVAK